MLLQPRLADAPLAVLADGLDQQVLARMVRRGDEEAQAAGGGFDGVPGADGDAEFAAGPAAGGPPRAQAPPSR